MECGDFWNASKANVVMMMVMNCEEVGKRFGGVFGLGLGGKVEEGSED
jgi:hypothetical protein